MKRIKKYGIILLLLLVLTGLVWYGGSWLSLIDADARYRIPEKATLETSCKAGYALPVTLEVDCPRGDRIESVSVAPGQGSVSGKVAVIRRTTWRDARNRLDFSLLILRSGEIPAGKMEIKFARGKTTIVALPPLSAALAVPENVTQPQLAGTFIEPVAYGWITWSAGIVVVLLIGAAIWIWHRRHRRQKAADFYRQMLEDISVVRRDSITPEAGVAHLTDLVRRYLDFRFACSIESASTWEFLRKLEQKESPLPPEIHPFLREFLRYADQVKFACAGAEWSNLADAAARAADLVRSTMPQEKEAKS